MIGVAAGQAATVERLRLVKADGRVYTHPAGDPTAPWTLDVQATRERLAEVGVGEDTAALLIAEFTAQEPARPQTPAQPRRILGGLTALAARRKADR